MFLSDGGYSGVQYNNAQLKEKAKEIAARIPHFLKRLDAQAVAVTGKSGLSLAFAAQMFCDFPIIVVRKKGENSHGNPIEGTTGVDVKRYIILDDFIASGATIRSIVESIDEYAEMCHYGTDTSWSAPRCVGVVQYKREYDSGDMSIKGGRVNVYGLQDSPARY